MEMGLGNAIIGTGSRLASTTRNALEVVRFGGFETGELPSPSLVVASDRVHRLLRYFAEKPDGDTGPPVLLVPPLMFASGLYDVSEKASAVAALRANGIDPWVVDFGAPEHEEGGLERTLADHVLAISFAIERVRTATGRPVHLAGYSQGGMFCYQAAAYRRSRDVASVVVFGSPVDTRRGLPLGIPEDTLMRILGGLAARTVGGQSLPAWVARTGFQLIDPVSSIRQQLDFLFALHDREALLPRERQRQFMRSDGWVAYPGPAFAEAMRQFVVHNRMVKGGITIADELVTLADVESPVLVFTGQSDTFAPAPTVRAVVRAAPRATVYERSVPTGHFGLVVGSKASEITWPAVVGWIGHVDEDRPLPNNVFPCDPDSDDRPGAGFAERAGRSLWLAAQTGLGAARSVGHAAEAAFEAARDLGGEALVALPRLARLTQIQPKTRISMGLLLDEAAHRAPDNVLFLFEDRSHTHGGAKHRIDSVVRGLVSLGVRRGEHVGVLMAMRPSALTAVAALNRLGAIAVLLRPDGSVQREAELGAVTRIVADPENADAAAAVGVEILVLGGGAGPRALGPGVTDMERIDPDTVTLPAWYRANPGLARDVGFIVFTGDGDGTRVNRITNHRWALSAFGTASAAALGDGDTVYVVAPIHHPSALLTGIGGAIAGGARIAMTTGFDPVRFWDEARRYGVTVATYTWTMLRALVEAPPNIAERHHPVRLFAGSGMPAGLWRRVTERFAPARVLEFYTSSEGEAILVNVPGTRRGAGGRPLPGSAEVRIASWDLEANDMAIGPDGFTRECAVGEIGMLMARVDPGSLESGVPLRGVFAAEDAWVSTGDLFYREPDGTLWLTEPASALVHTEDGPVPTAPARTALEALDAVELAVVYGVPERDKGSEQIVAAVTVRDRKRLERKAVVAALASLPVAQRPTAIRITSHIPTTTWYRPRIDLLVDRGLQADGDTIIRANRPRTAYREKATA
jgi:putative long chain acyl-CoA synthase